jgi:hypothetical protein
VWCHTDAVRLRMRNVIYSTAISWRHFGLLLSSLVTSVWRKWCDKHKVVELWGWWWLCRNSAWFPPKKANKSITSDLIWSVYRYPKIKDRQARGSPASYHYCTAALRARRSVQPEASQGLSRGKWFSYRRPPRAWLARAAPPTCASLRPAPCATRPWPACRPPPGPGGPTQLAPCGAGRKQRGQGGAGRWPVATWPGADVNMH